MISHENNPKSRDAETPPADVHRVVFLTENLGGGSGNHLLAMLDHWDPASWQAEIISSAQPTTRVPPAVAITSLSTPQGWLNRYPVAQIHRAAAIRRYLGGRPPDLVHAYFFWSIMYGRLLKRLGLIRLLVENREDEGFNWGAHEYALLRLSRGMPDRVICVSEAVRRVVLERERLDPSRVVVINNGVRSVPSWPDRGTALRRELGIGEDSLIVGMVANFNRAIKGVSRFLDAIPAIIRIVPSARFLIVGRGTEERVLRQKSRTLGIEKCLLFAGYQHDIGKWYGIMDVSVLTSLSEGLSITLLESMSYGLPVVVTRVGGNSEVVVDGKTGYLVPPGDVSAFVDRVVELLRNPHLRARMGEEGRCRIQRQFQIRAVAEQYLRTYSTLLRGHEGIARSLPTQ